MLHTTSRPAPAGPARTSVLVLSPLAFLGSLFSFEALLVLYMFAGVYKGDPRFAWVPVDPTALFFGLSVVAGSFILVLSPIYKRGLLVVFAMLALVVWLAVTLRWSPSQDYGSQKVFFMATLELWAVAAAALIVAPDPERVKRLLTLILLVSVWLGIESLLIHFGTDRAPVQVAGNTYLSIGRVCGLGAVIALIAWLFGRGQSLRGLLFLALFLMLSYVLTIGGGRGPLIAIALSLAVPIVTGVQLTRRKILYTRYQAAVLALAAAMVGVLTVYMVTTDTRLRTLQRFERLIEGEFGTSETQRAKLFQDAFETLPEAPVVGGGAGGWIDLTSSTISRHPHNLFLEIMVETGLVGLAIFLVLLGTTLRAVSLDRLRYDPIALCVFMLFVSAFTNAMFSGDLPENRVLFLMLGLLVVFTVPRPAASPERPARAPAPQLGPGAGRPAGASLRQRSALGQGT